jgi:mannitol/fructose-specific phosphotransferase system IIA component (Ntr-type)
MSVRLSDLLDHSRINLDLRSTEHAAAIQEVAQLLESHPAVTDYAGFYRELLARDRLDTTYLGHGVALPHSRTVHVTQNVVAVGRSAPGIAYEVNQPPVRLLFVLGTPRDQPADYLQLVSALCRLIKDEANRAALLGAPTPEAFIATVIALERKILDR